MQLHLLPKLLLKVSLKVMHLFQVLLEFLGLMYQVEVLLLKLTEDLVQVVRIVEAKVFIEEVLIELDKILGKEHLKLVFPIFFVHIFSLQLLELDRVCILPLFDQPSCSTSWI